MINNNFIQNALPDVKDVDVKLQYNNKIYTRSILTSTLVLNIRESMPNAHKFAPKWKLLFSTFEHGFTFTTMIKCLYGGSGPYLIVIKSDNEVFGVFFEGNINQKNIPFGKPTTFVFTTVSGHTDYITFDEKDTCSMGDKDGKEDDVAEVQRKVVKDREIANERECSKDTENDVCSKPRTNEESISSFVTKNFKAYNAINAEQVFCIANLNFIAFGCSDGKYGLLVNNPLRDGESHCVSSFNNSLLSSNATFNIACLEIWHIEM